jgi:hypothetical protein
MTVVSKRAELYKVPYELTLLAAVVKLGVLNSSGQNRHNKRQEREFAS